MWPLFTVITRVPAFIIVAYGGTFVSARVMLFLTGFREALKTNTEMSSKVISCMDINFVQTWSKECNEARNYIPQSPIGHGIDKIVEHTYSCGDLSCLDIILTLMNTWAGILLLFTCCVFGLTLLWFGMAKKFKNKKQRERHEELSYLAFSSHHHHDDSALPSPSGSRFRNSLALTGSHPAPYEDRQKWTTKV